MSAPTWIVLSAYNGAAHIVEQVASIQAQAFTEWVLLVRDDGSSDNTPDILDRLAAADRRIRVLPSTGNVGVVRSFSLLVQAAWEAGARYVFLSDQDDVWVPGKLDLMLAAMREAEAGARDVPVLVHSDLAVVDASLNVLSPSFMKYQKLRDQGDDAIRVLLTQNFVTGCTCLLNRALMDLALPFPADAAMHDWWLAQCAAAAGRIRFLPEPLVLYRQHGANVVGARGTTALLLRALRSPRRWWRNSVRIFAGGVAQCRRLGERLDERLGRMRPEDIQRAGADPAPQPPPARVVYAYVAAMGGARTGPGRLAAVHRLGVGPRIRLARPFYFLRVLMGAGREFWGGEGTGLGMPPGRAAGPSALGTAGAPPAADAHG